MPTYTPLDSPIKSILLGSFEIIPQNTLCRFEKIEFTESVFDLFPTGCLVVRDLGDVVSYVKNLSASADLPANETAEVCSARKRTRRRLKWWASSSSKASRCWAGCRPAASISTGASGGGRCT